MNLKRARLGLAALIAFAALAGCGTTEEAAAPAGTSAAAPADTTEPAPEASQAETDESLPTRGPDADTVSDPMYVAAFCEAEGIYQNTVTSSESDAVEAAGAVYIASPDIIEWATLQRARGFGSNNETDISYTESAENAIASYFADNCDGSLGPGYR